MQKNNKKYYDYTAPFPVKLRKKPTRGAFIMKGFVCGAVTGGVIGMVAAAVTMPYVEPEMKRAIRKCRRMVKCRLRHMH